MTLQKFRAITLSLIIFISVFTAAGTGLTGATTASADMSITGVLTYEDGSNVSGWEVSASNTFDPPITNDTDSTGAFSVNISQNDTYDVWYEQSNPNKTTSENFPRDGKADLWALGTANTTVGEDIGSKTIPNASLLNVKVVNEAGNPVANRTVFLRVLANGGEAHVSGETNEKGQMVLHGNDVPGIEITGSVDVRVQGGEEYTTNLSSVSVSSNQTHTVVLSKPAHLNGTVNSADGTPAENDTVVIGAEGSPHELRRTDSTGSYSISLPGDGVYEQEFYQGDLSQAGYRTAPADNIPDLYALGTVSVSGETNENTTLPDAHNLTIKVVREDGTAVSGADVDIWQEKDTVTAHGQFQTDSNGTVELELAGDVNLNVHPPSDTNLAGSYKRVTADSDKTITITLPSTVTVSGNVTGADGQPAEGYEVTYHTINEPHYSDRGYTGTSGTYSLQASSNRTHHIDLTQAGREGGEAFADDGIPDIYALGFADVDGTNETSNLEVPYGNDLEISVVGPDGEPVPDAFVDVRHIKDNRVTDVFGSTNTDGQFVINGANKTGIEVNGTVYVDVSAPSGNDLGGAEAEYTVTSNRSVKIQLEETVTVSGRVVDASESGIEGGTVHLNSFDESITDFRAVTDADGSFSGQAGQNATFEAEFTQRSAYGSTSFPKDGIPDAHPLGTVETGTSNENIGTVQLPEGHLVNVTVVNQSGAPVEDVNVNIQIEGAESSAFVWGMTNADGELVLDDAAEPGLEANGNLEIYVDPETTEYASANVEATADSDKSVEITLEPTRNVTTEVKKPDGTAAAGDRITTYPVGGGSGETTWTNETGHATLHVAKGDDYEVGFMQVENEGDYQLSFPVDGVPDIYALGISDNNTTDLGSTTLPSAHNLTVEVVNSAGEPVDAQVYFNHNNNGASFGRSRHTDENGTTRAELVGTVDIHVDPDDSEYRENYTRIEVTNDQTVKLVVSKGVPITGQLKNPNGTAASGWHMEAFDSGGDGDRTDSSGNFTIRVEPGNTYDLAYKQTDWNSDTPSFPKDGIVDLYAFSEVDVGASGTDVGTKQLPRGHLLNVTVVNENGTTLSGMEVDVMPVNGDVSDHHPGHTNDQGEVVLDGADKPGIEANGTIRLHVEGTDTYGDAYKEVNVTNDSSIEIVMEEPAQISGRLVYPNNTTHANDTVVHFGSESADSGFQITETESDGTFSFTAPRVDGVDVQYYQGAAIAGDGTDMFPRDGVVDIYAVKQVDTTEGDVDLGNYTLPEGHVVNVTVYDEDGDPVRNATISIIHRQGGFNNSQEYGYANGGFSNIRTDPDGQLHWGGLQNENYTIPPGVELAGNVTIGVSPPDGDDRFVDETYKQNLTVKSERNLSFTLEEKSHISGQFVDSSGQDLNESIVAITGDTWVVRLTNDTGGFNIQVPEDGNYTVNYVQRNGSGGWFPRDGVTDLYTTTEVTVDNGNVSVGKQTVPDAAGVLDVKVVDENGTAVENASVQIRTNETTTQSIGNSSRTDSDGFYQVDGKRGIEANGSYTIKVKPPENATEFENTTYTRNVTVTGDTTEEITLQPNVSTGPSAVGKVVLPNGTPADNSQVAFNQATWKVIRTDENGNYSTNLPQNGTYEIFVAQWDGETKTPRDGIVDIYDVGTYNISGPTDIPTTELPKGYVLDVAVVDQKGDPVENASVTYHPNNTTTGWVVQTNSDGLAANSDPNRSITGVEVLGNVTVDVERPTNDSSYVNETITKDVTVTENDTLRVTLTKKEPNISVDYAVESTDVQSGDPINVTATVTNTGNATGTENVTLTIENKSVVAVQTTEQVTVEPGESKTVSFSETVNDGTWEVSVNDRSSTMVIVNTPVSVSVDAPKQMGVDQNETVYVTVSGVDAGVGTVDLNVSVSNGSVVSITDATTTIGDKDDSSVGTGTNARLIGFDGSTADSGEVRVAKVVINASNVGTTNVQVHSIRSLGDEGGNSYVVAGTQNDTVDVVAVPAIGDKDQNPADLDDDGKYEDINGDGTFDLNDVTALFENSDDEVVQQYADAFDFNDDGEFDIVDVDALYRMYKSDGGA